MGCINLYGFSEYGSAVAKFFKELISSKLTYRIGSRCDERSAGIRRTGD